MALDVDIIHRQFPILQKKIDGYPLTYLDSAATAQKPDAVLEAMHNYYTHDNGNAHRGMHVLAERATVAYEGARGTVQKFLHAKYGEEIIFTRGATESINLVARTWGKKNLRKGDIVVLSLLEHHSNIVPWLQLQEEHSIEIRWIDCDDDGRLRLEILEEFLATKRVKLVAITAQSNVLGIRPPLETIIRLSHGAGALVLVDAAQSVAHGPTDVQMLDCDFLAFSGHKLYGPMGIGVLYAKLDLLRAIPPFLGGGMMIEHVTQELYTAAEIPQKFEAGTQSVADAVGLAAAIEWLSAYHWNDIIAHDRTLLEETIRSLGSIRGLKILGPQDTHDVAGCVSFVIDDVHPHDLTEILGRQGICLRAGHHCAQPLHRRLGIAASTRASFGIYNTKDEIEVLPGAILQAVNQLRGS